MASRRRVRIDRVIILILSGLLVGGGIGFGIYKLFDLFKDEKKETTPIVEDTTNNIFLSIDDYDVYDDSLDELGFNFIIANITLESNDLVCFDLGQLETSEKIKLNDINSYVSKLADKGYVFNDVNVSGYVQSSDNKTSCKLIIPYKTDDDELTIYNKQNTTNSLIFDLDIEHKLAVSLKLEDKSQTIEVEDCAVVVSSCYISTSMLHNGDEYSLGSSQKIFTFRIKTTNVNQGVKLISAQYLRDGSSTAIDALSSDYCSEKDDNALGQELVLGDNGALFFKVVTNEIQPTYDGVLLLKFSNNDAIFEIPTTLQ